MLTLRGKNKGFIKGTDKRIDTRIDMVAELHSDGCFVSEEDKPRVMVTAGTYYWFLSDKNKEPVCSAYITFVMSEDVKGYRLQFRYKKGEDTISSCYECCRVFLTRELGFSDEEVLDLLDRKSFQRHGIEYEEELSDDEAELVFRPTDRNVAEFCVYGRKRMNDALAGRILEFTNGLAA